MSHLNQNKKKLIARLNRLKGQLEALSKSIESDEDCFKVLQQCSSCRGALNGLMGELVTDHVKEHIVKASTKQKAAEAGDELIEIMGSFWK